MHTDQLSDTSLGAPGTWPPALKTLVEVILGSNQPMFVVWGPNRALLYNDAYAEVLANKHPAIGRDFLEVWSEIRDDLVPLVDRAYAGEPTHMDNIRLVMERKGYREETHWAYAYTPIRDSDGTVGGFLCACHEVTKQVLAERHQAFRLRLEERIRGLGDPRAVMDAAVEELGRHLGASRVGYSEARPDDQTVDCFSCYADGVAPIFGSYQLDDFGPASIAKQRRGKTEMAEDVQADPEQVQSTWAAIETRAFVSVPLVEDGRFRASLYVNHRDPHRWTPEEIQLIEEVAERTWSAVERARAEARLRASEEFNRRVLASSADCIKVLDLDGRLEFMSEGGMCVMEVEDFSSINGTCWPDFWAGQGHELALGAVAEAKRGSIGRFQGFATTLKGSPRWWDVIVTAISGPDGNPEKLLSISRDITAVKNAEVRLRELNETLEAQVAERTAERDRMWEISPDLMLVIGFDGVFLRVNPAWTTVLGYTADELVGRHVNEFVLPDDHATTIDAYEWAAKGGWPRIENRYRHKDGSIRRIAWVAAPSGDVTYATGRDVTAERQAAEDLEQARDALRHAQKMEAVGQLTGGLAHDFNNLLTGIMGNLELLQHRVARGRFDDVDRLINSAQGAGRRAASLTQRLLAFARRQTLHPKPTDVNRLIAGMEELLRRTVGPAVDIEVVGAAGLWTVMIDSGQMENALLNLCINARDAMPGGGKITIETANKWLDDRAAKARDLPPGQYLSVCVTDTGTGMTPDIIEHAFEPFFTTKPLGQGTGLGLSMIYGFARQSGGQVRIYSELGTGTTMCIYLPRHFGAAEADDAMMSSAVDVNGAGETILVVDDEATIRHLIDEVLDGRGYTVLGAADGIAGLRVLQTGSRIDLLITDVGLPNGMNGRQLADAARMIRPNLKVLFITGYAENAAVNNGLLEPGMDLLTKPFALDDLVRKVHELLGTTEKRSVVSP